MSDEDQEDKTEDPSERKKRESRAKGSVVRSKELTNLIALLGGILILKTYSDRLSTNLKSVFHESLSFSTDVFKDDYYIVKYLKETIVNVAGALIPILLFFVVVTLVGGVAVGGLNFNIQSANFKANRLNPIAGLKKIFSSKTIVELLKSFLKFALLAITFAVVVNKILPEIVQLDQVDVIVSIEGIVSLFLWAFMLICLPLILVTVVDVPYQIWNLNQTLKMTKQEVKDENKDSDGNPEVKSRLRKMQNEISKRKMMKELPKADVIITNPEHFAVALKYDPTQPGAPILIAKGLDLMAQLIKNIASTYKVPIVEAPSVARSIYYNVELNHEIPTGLYIAVAKILTYIHELNLYKKGKMNKPKLRKDFQIPSELVR